MFVFCVVDRYELNLSTLEIIRSFVTVLTQAELP